MSCFKRSPGAPAAMMRVGRGPSNHRDDLGIDMSMQLWLVVTLVPLVGGALLIYAGHKRPAWRAPIRWAATGIILYVLFVEVARLLG